MTLTSDKVIALPRPLVDPVVGRHCIPFGSGSIRLPCGAALLRHRTPRFDPARSDVAAEDRPDHGPASFLEPSSTTSAVVLQ